MDKKIDSPRKCRLLAGDLIEVIFAKPTIGAARGNRGDRIRIPTGMDKSQAIEIEPQRQGQEPCRAIQRLRRADPETLAETPMLGRVLCVARAQSCAIWVQPMEEQRVEFMVPHDADRGAGFHERHDPIQHSAIIRVRDGSTGVDEITKKGDASAGRDKAQARFKPFGIGMQVGDDDCPNQRRSPIHAGTLSLQAPMRPAASVKHATARLSTRRPDQTVTTLVASPAMKNRKSLAMHTGRPQPPACRNQPSAGMFVLAGKAAVFMIGQMIA